MRRRGGVLPVAARAHRAARRPDDGASGWPGRGGCARRWLRGGGAVTDPSWIWSCGRGLALPCSSGRSRWGDFSLLRSGSGGLDHPDPGKDGGDPCTRDGGLRSDLGENLLLAIAKAGDGDVVCVVPFLKASPWRCKRPLYATSGGNPRSVDRMTAALWCRFPPGGVILGGAHGSRD